jgi:hypothetical protein
MSKSPYELRTELLNMAITILHAQHSADHSKKMQALGKDAADCGPPTAPTTEQIIEEAQKLNDFIQTR